MKRISTSLSLIGAVALGLTAACNDDTFSDLFTFGVGVDVDRQTVPGVLPISCDLEALGQLIPGLLLPLTINLRDEEELEGQGIIGAFKSVVLDEVELSVTDVPPGDTDDWDFVDSIRFYADDPSTPAPRVLVAELDPVPTNATTITIPGTGVDISDIASADNFIVSGEVTGRLPCDEVHFVGEADFDVELF